MSTAVTEALSQRLGAVEEVLGGPGVGSARAEVRPLWDQVVDIARLVQRRGDTASAWLLTVGLTGALPDQALVSKVWRAVSLKDTEAAGAWLLHATAPLAMRNGHASATLRIESERPLVDVDFTAKTAFLTGIQRVVKGVVSQWASRYDIEPVAWTARGGAYRTLLSSERERLLERAAPEFKATGPGTGEEPHELVVPWGVPLVLIEVPAAEASDRLAAMAAHTEASVRLVGHDCIPISSAELVSLAEPEKFGRYLELVKHSERVACVSRSAAAEFEGFGQALTAQGLRGPVVSTCALPSVSPVSGTSSAAIRPERPVVACIGSVGRRKNQSTLVAAAELLWRRGVDFELRILGHVETDGGLVPALAEELQRAGRPLVLESGVSDARLAETLSTARCLVMLTLHEGFGLPIVEALSHGVPVLTSDHGNMRELAEGSGGLVVDPEDVDAVASALSALVGDDELHARLVGQARNRPVRSWQDYTDELWEVLLG